MFSVPFNPMGHATPPVAKIGESPSIEETHTALSLPIQELQTAHSLKDKMRTEPIQSQGLDRSIESEIGSLSHMNDHIEQIQQDAESTSTQTVGMIIQYVISDIVLKGSAATAETGLPLLFNLTVDSLQGLIPATEIIKLATDILDLGTGVTLIIYRAQILNASRSALENLKSQNLTPEQHFRLQHLEKLVSFEEQLLDGQINEQIIRTTKNTLSYIPTVLSWIADKPLLNAIFTGVTVALAAVTTFLEGFFFFRAHQNLTAHQEWSNDFKQWMKSQTAIVEILDKKDPRFLEVTKKQAAQMLTKRAERHEHKLNQIQDLNRKLQTGEMKLPEIQKRVIGVKQPGLHHYLSQLDVQNLSLTQFHAKLNEKLDVPIDSKVAAELRKALLKLHVMAQTQGIPEEQREEVRKKISALEEECLHEWVGNQDKETLLSSYVEYHSILDSTIKHSLAEMVKKKHKIEKSLLKMKTIQTGTKFTAAAIILAVVTALAIIAAVTNPIGAAVLIVTLLTASSAVLSAGLFAAGYVHSHIQKPGMTEAFLKGAYIKLYYYYAREALSKLKEKIQDYVSVSKQEKRDLVADVIARSPAVSAQLIPRKIEKESTTTAFTTTHDAQDHYQRKQRQSEEWAAKAALLAEELEKIAWKDFADKAQLQVAETSKQFSDNQSFDTLETINKLLTECDFDLLSDETKKMIEKQFAVNMNILQVEIQKDPTAVKRVIRQFFNMQNEAFIKFVGMQQEFA